MLNAMAPQFQIPVYSQQVNKYFFLFSCCQKIQVCHAIITTSSSIITTIIKKGKVKIKSELNLLMAVINGKESTVNIALGGSTYPG